MKENNNKMHQSKTLWIGDIQPWWSRNYVANLFKEKDNLLNVKIIKQNRKSLKGQYFGFLEFKDHLSAKKSLQKYNGKQIKWTQNFFNLNWSFFGGNEKRRKEQLIKNSNNSKSYQVYIGDIDINVTETQLLNIFLQRYKSTQTAKIIVNPVSKLSKGYGFVKFSNKADIYKAIIEMNGFMLNGKRLKLNQSHEKQTELDNTQKNKKQHQSQITSDFTQMYYKNYGINSQFYYNNPKNDQCVQLPLNNFSSSNSTNFTIEDGQNLLFISEQDHYYQNLQQQQKKFPEQNHKKKIQQQFFVQEIPKIPTKLQTSKIQQQQEQKKNRVDQGLLQEKSQKQSIEKNKKQSIEKMKKRILQLIDEQSDEEQSTNSTNEKEVKISYVQMLQQQDNQTIKI